MKGKVRALLVVEGDFTHRGIICNSKAFEQQASSLLMKRGRPKQPAERQRGEGQSIGAQQSERLESQARPVVGTDGRIVRLLRLAGILRIKWRSNREDQEETLLVS